ncbi:MAG: ATP-binding protein [Bacteroidia bacterium]|jgi:hypothetical protein
MQVVHRVAEAGMKKWFRKNKVNLLTGARQVGKTTLLQHLFSNQSSVLWLNADESTTRETLSRHDLVSLRQVFGTYKTVIIDEVQRIENAGLLLKLCVDQFKGVQFIATGSSSLDISETVFEPLTGRQILFHLFPFALKELYPKNSPFEIAQQLPFHLVYGSYPDICNNRQDADTLLLNLSDQYLYKDVLAWNNIRKPTLLNKLLQLLAYQVGSEVSLHELGRQLGVKSDTIDNYIDLLEKSFVIFRLPSMSNNPRKEISKMNKIYFWDNGIRNAVIGNFNALNIRNDAGALWENLMVSERKKMNAWLHPKINSYFWRNYNQSEVDYVEMDKKQLSAFEMKWGKGNAKVSRAFSNLYPQADTDVITPENFVPFCRINEPA